MVAKRWACSRLPEMRLTILFSAPPRLCDEILPAGRFRIFNERFQGVDIAPVVAGLVDRRFRDEGGVGQAGIVQQPPKRLKPDSSLPDMLVAIQARAASRLGVVAVPDAHLGEANGRI